MEKDHRRPQRAERRWTDAAFRAHVREWAGRIGVQPVEIRLRPMRRKWASCSSRGRLTFDTGLLRCEQAFRDYVIVHELLHLQVPNHGKLFKSLLSAMVPGWEQFETRGQQPPGKGRPVDHPNLRRDGSVQLEAWLAQRKDSHNSHKPPSSDGPAKRPRPLAASCKLVA